MQQKNLQDNLMDLRFLDLHDLNEDDKDNLMIILFGSSNRKSVKLPLFRFLDLHDLNEDDKDNLLTILFGSSNRKNVKLPSDSNNSDNNSVAITTIAVKDSFKSVHVEASENKAQIKESAPLKNARSETVIDMVNGSLVTPNVSLSVSACETSKPKRSYASVLKKNARDKIVIDAANGSSLTPTASSSVSASETSKPKRSNASLFKKDDMIDQNGSSAQEQTTSVDTTPEKQEQNDLPSTLNVVLQDYCYDPDMFMISEFLSNYQMEKHTLSLIPRGLTNCKNYCCINSILQALLACPPFYNLLMAISILQEYWTNFLTFSPLIDNMVRFVCEFAPMTEIGRLPTKNDSMNKRGDDAVVDIQSDVAFEPSYVYTMLNAANIFSQDGQQEDAEEYLSCLLNGINNEMSEVMGPRYDTATRHTEFGRTPLSDIFRGQLRSSISRAGEQQPTENIQPFFTLQLDVHEVDSVRSAFELLTGKEQLEEMWCSETRKRIEAWKQVTLEELPVILILHLKWFVYKFDSFSNGCSKILKSMEFPVDLKIDDEFLSPDTMKKLSPKEKQYKLFAVTYHDGKEMTNGHYVTDAFHVGYGSWIRYDDSSVKHVSESDVLSPTSPKVPYLIYYRRCDTICDN